MIGACGGTVTVTEFSELCVTDLGGGQLRIEAYFDATLGGGESVVSANCEISGSDGELVVTGESVIKVPRAVDSIGTCDRPRAVCEFVLVPKLVTGDSLIIVAEGVSDLQLVFPFADETCTDERDLPGACSGFGATG